MASWSGSHFSANAAHAAASIGSKLGDLSCPGLPLPDPTAKGLAHSGTPNPLAAVSDYTLRLGDAMRR